MGVDSKVRDEERHRPLKPLAAGTYFVRNLGKTAPLMGVIMLAVMMIAGIVSLVNSIPHSVRTTYAYSQEQLAIIPRLDFEVNPDLQRKLREEAPVPIEHISIARAISTRVRSIVGNWPFVVIALSPGDMDFFLDRMDVREIQGRKPEPAAAEVLVSEPVARNRNLQIGSVLLKPDDRDNYSPNEVKVVGIAKTDKWFMTTSFEYHQLYHFPPYNNLLVYAHNAQDQRVLDRWAEEIFKGERADVFAYHLLEEETNDMFGILYRILDVIILTLVFVLTLLMGMLMNIYQSQRLVEFGLLQAIGYTKKQLLRRVFAESVLVIVLGWVLGVLAAHAMLRIVEAVLMHPNAFALNTVDPAAYLYTLVIPIAILTVATLTVVIRFRRFDPVSIVERRLV
jgi:ABC-type lipoprotein release transport system permease subunit